MEKSRQYTFINNQYGFTISFLSGQGLLDEVSQIHNIGPNALSFYKNTLLSSTQMLNFLKVGESLGFYIDSESPYFRFKIEIGNTGSFRTLLLPEEFEDFPTKLTGRCRIHKFMPRNEPYTSILEFEDHPLEDLVNEVITKSYQSYSKVVLSPNSENSIMITKLPPSNVNKKIEGFDDLTLQDVEKKFQDFITNALALNSQKQEDIIKFFEEREFNYIGSKEVHFHCPCSKERMVENLFTLPKADRESLFNEKNYIETRCDYCNTIYNIEKEEIIVDLQ